MKQSTERILTTHVGSLPRPDGLAEALTALDRGTLGEAELAALPQRVREGVAAIVAREVETGIDVVSDGELSKFGYATYVKQRLTGFDGENGPLALSEFADFPNFRMSTAIDVTNPACTGPVAYQGHEALQADIANLTTALDAAPAPATEAFMNAASPGIVADYLANQHYASEEEYLYALADAMKEEYDGIVAAGFVLQLDCPDLALGRHLAPEPLSVPDFRKRLELRIEVLNHALRDVAPDRVRMHVCWGNYESPHHHDVPFAEIADLILAARPAGLLVEAANPRHAHEWRVFEDVALPEGKVIVPGVIDTLTSYVEHPEVVAQRIVQYAQVVGRENVIAGTDCGFATFANFTPVDPDIAWAKLRSLAEGAEIASRELWATPAETAVSAVPPDTPTLAQGTDHGNRSRSGRTAPAQPSAAQGHRLHAVLVPRRRRAVGAAARPVRPRLRLRDARLHRLHRLVLAARLVVRRLAGVALHREPLGARRSQLDAHHARRLVDVLLFLPKLAGLEPIGIPYIWFPIALIPLTYFGGRPFDKLGQPYAGLAYAGVTLIGTVLFAGILKKAGIDFFSAEVAGAKGNILVATWTNVGLLFAWLFNMWPVGKLAQPMKGIASTVGTLAISLAIYGVLVNGFDPADYGAVIFGQFCSLWAHVSFAGIGLFDVLSWGYEDDPAGAGPELAAHRERTAVEVGVSA